MHKIINKCKTILIPLFIILLVFGNIYFYSNSQKLAYNIVIGTPVKGESGDIGNNFSDSSPISDKDEFNTLIFSIMDATSVNRPTICETLPNATIMFNDYKYGIQYYSINVWVRNNSVFIETTGDKSTYKIINSSRCQDFLNIIQKYMLNP